MQCDVCHKPDASSDGIGLMLCNDCMNPPPSSNEPNWAFLHEQGIIEMTLISANDMRKTQSNYTSDQYNKLRAAVSLMLTKAAEKESSHICMSVDKYCNGSVSRLQSELSLLGYKVEKSSHRNESNLNISW